MVYLSENAPQSAARWLRDIARKAEYHAKQIDDDTRITQVRALSKRVGAQRRELSRLNRRMRELRADIHERDEEIRRLKATSTPECTCWPTASDPNCPCHRPTSTPSQEPGT